MNDFARDAKETGAKGTNVWLGALAGLAALLVGLGLGRFGYPPLIPELVQHHWFTPAQAAYLGATNLVGYLLGALLAARLSKSLPTRWTVRISMLLAAASFLVCIRPIGFAWFFLWRLIAGIAAGFLMVIAIPSILARTPEKHRGRVGGIMFIGVGAGMMLAGTIIPVLARHGLAAAWASVGIVSLALAIVAWPYWSKRADSQGIELESLGSPQAQGARFSRNVALLMVAYCANAIGFVPHSIFWVDFIARGLGRGLARGSHFWVLLGAAAAAGPVVAGAFADWFGFRRTLPWGLFAAAIALALPVFSTAAWSLALSSVGVGAMVIGVTSLTSGRVTEMIRVSEQKEVWGWMTVAFAVTYAAGAWIFSFLFARTGSYRLLFALSAVTLLAGCAVAALSSTQPRSDS